MEIRDSLNEKSEHELDTMRDKDNTQTKKDMLLTEVLDGVSIDHSLFEQVERGSAEGNKMNPEEIIL